MNNAKKFAEMRVEEKDKRITELEADKKRLREAIQKDIEDAKDECASMNFEHDCSTTTTWCQSCPLNNLRATRKALGESK